MAKTIVGKILETIFSTFKENWLDFVAKLYKKVPSEVKEKVSIGIRIVDNFKKFIDSPVADFITALIPGELDDKIKEQLREYLSKWEQLKDYDVTLPTHAHVLASTINQELTGLSFGQSALTTEVIYQQMKKDGEVA